MGRASGRKRNRDHVPPPLLDELREAELTPPPALSPRAEVPLHRRTGTRVAAFAVVTGAAVAAVFASRDPNSPAPVPVRVPPRVSAPPIPRSSQARIERSLDGRAPLTAEAQEELKRKLGEILGQLLVTPPNPNSTPNPTESAPGLVIFPEVHLFEEEMLNPNLASVTLKRLQSQLFEAMAHVLKTYDIRHVVYEGGPDRNWVASILKEYGQWSPDRRRPLKDFLRTRMRLTGQSSAITILETALDRSLTFEERYERLAPYRGEYPAFLLLQAIYWDCPDINFVSPDILGGRQQGANQRWAALQLESRALLNGKQPVARKLEGGWVMANDVHAQLESGDFAFAEPYCRYRESYSSRLNGVVSILGAEREQRWTDTLERFSEGSSLLSVGAAHTFGVRDGLSDDRIVVVMEMSDLRAAFRLADPGTLVLNDLNDHSIFTHQALFGHEIDATPYDFSFRDGAGVEHNCSTVLAGTTPSTD